MKSFRMLALSLFSLLLSPLAAFATYNEVVKVHVTSVPTLGEWGMLGSAASLGVAAVWIIRRRSKR